MEELPPAVLLGLASSQAQGNRINIAGNPVLERLLTPHAEQLKGLGFKLDFTAKDAGEKPKRVSTPSRPSQRSSSQRSRRNASATSSRPSSARSVGRRSSSANRRDGSKGAGKERGKAKTTLTMLTKARPKERARRPIPSNVLRIRPAVAGMLTDMLRSVERPDPALRAVGVEVGGAVQVPSTCPSSFLLDFTVFLFGNLIYKPIFQAVHNFLPCKLPAAVEMLLSKGLKFIPDIKAAHHADLR